MGYAAKILADSMSPDGVRLTTMEVTFPRFVLAEFNTHRMFSRNSASSRAIPVEKRIAAVREDPFYPTAFGKNQRGMQAAEDLGDAESREARGAWTAALEAALCEAGELARLGVHKQLANRLLEPFLWHTVIVSATEWSNFFALRCHKDAQPEIREIAEMMRDLYVAHEPDKFVGYNEYHLPLVDCSEIRELDPFNGRTDISFGERVEVWKAISVGRCARVSALTHDGKRDLIADVELCKRLHKSGHMSPFEHVARPMTQEEQQNSARGFCGNFNGWIQYRKELLNEDDFSRIVQ